MKRPSFQFYPGDWLRDAGLRSCSVFARGLWIDMLCLMHDGNPYGYLRVGEEPIAEDGIARILGASRGEVRKGIAELEQKGVLSRDDAGTIFSRRMIRDEEIREKRAAGGSKSLDNPNVPRRKDILNGIHNGHLQGSNTAPSPAVRKNAGEGEDAEPSEGGAGGNGIADPNDERFEWAVRVPKLQLSFELRQRLPRISLERLKEIWAEVTNTRSVKSRQGFFVSKIKAETECK